jgi:hypothetical protein
MRYWMYDKKQRGDAGPMSIAFWQDEEGTIQQENQARPRVGVAMRVGTPFARSYQAQDWWQTTPIEEIIKDTPEEVVFRTRSGSEYTWKII